MRNVNRIETLLNVVDSFGFILTMRNVNNDMTWQQYTVFLRFILTMRNVNRMRIVRNHLVK